jgi:Zn-dependent peptidase ImmA (M78 family)
MNLTPPQVEELTGISAELISKWEQSKETPSLEQLEILAKHYRCPVGYFFITQPPTQFPETINFRGLTRERFENLSYKSRLKIDEFITLADTLTDIVRESNISISPEIPIRNLDDDIGDIVKKEREAFGFSDKVREKWLTPIEAFYFWKNAIEKRGVYVISLSLVVNEVRGASRWEKESPPVILVNKSDSESATGRTFTLLHEWAHLMLRQPGVICDFIGDKELVNVEWFANKFAAEMMVLNSELRDYLKTKGLFEYKARWGDNDINVIKNHFKVSKDVIAIALENLHLAPSGFYKIKREQWDKRKAFFRNIGRPGHNKTKVARRFEELGKPFSSLLANAYINGNVSINRLSKTLDIKVERLNDFVNYVKVADY